WSNCLASLETGAEKSQTPLCATLSTGTVVPAALTAKRAPRPTVNDSSLRVIVPSPLKVQEAARASGFQPSGMGVARSAAAPRSAATPDRSAPESGRQAPTTHTSPAAQSSSTTQPDLLPPQPASDDANAQPASAIMMEPRILRPRDQSSVDAQHLPVDERCLVGGKEHVGARHVLGRAEAAERRLLLHAIEHVLGHFRRHVGGDEAGRDGV